MTTRTEQYIAKIERFGYVVMAEAIPGHEETFCVSLVEASERIDAVLATNANRYGFRGTSKRALEALHADLPSPGFGIELAA